MIQTFSSKNVLPLTILYRIYLKFLQILSCLGPEGTPDFKWRGWSKDFFGVWNFRVCNFGIFWAEKVSMHFLNALIWEGIFWGVRSSAITYIQTSFWKNFRVISFNAVCNFWRLVNSSRDFWGDFVGSPRDFCPNSTTPVTWKSRVTPPGCLGCPKTRPSVPPCRKQGLIPQRTIS